MALLVWASAEEALDLLAPALAPQEAVYLNSLLELTSGLTGLELSDLEDPPPQRVLQLLSSPTEQVRLPNRGQAYPSFRFGLYPNCDLTALD